MEPKHRARNRASATKGTTALRHHQDGKGSSSQPTGYAVHVTPYLCAEKFIKSLTTDVRLGGGFFVCAQAARGPFPNARSACTCGGPAQRCCLLNATETEDPLFIHSMKLPFLVHNVLIETSSSSSPGHAAKNDMPGQTRCTAPSSTSCSAATIADIEIGTVLRHNHRRLPRQGGARGKLYRLFFHIGIRHPRRLVVLRQPSRTSKSTPCFGTNLQQSILPDQ